MRGHKVALLSGVGLLLGACAGPVILGVNLGTLSTVGSLASTAATGRGLGEHAVSALADKDCRLIEPVLRSDRQFCEAYDSPARKEDFNGLAGLFDKDKEAPATMLAEVAPQAGADIVVDKPETETTAARAVEAVAIEPVPGIAVAPAVPAAQYKPASLTRVVAAPPPPKVKPAAERTLAATGPYAVRVGTYANAGTAEAFARKLRDGGYQTRVSQMRGEGRKAWTVVHITGFRDAATAERAAAAIARDHGLPPGVVLTRA